MANRVRNICIQNNSTIEVVQILIYVILSNMTRKHFIPNSLYCTNYNSNVFKTMVFSRSHVISPVKCLLNNKSFKNYINELIKILNPNLISKFLYA